MTAYLYDVLDFLGSGICHQKILVTFEYNKVYMPVCSRCTGIYIGFLFSLIILLLIERRIKSEVPSTKVLVSITASVLFIGLDIFLTSYGIVEPNNLIRFITGFIVGWGFALIILPLSNSVMWQKAVKRKYLEKKINISIWLIAGVVVSFLFFISYKSLLTLWGFFSILGLMLFYAFIFLILLFTFLRKISNNIKSKGKYMIYLFYGLLSSAAFLAVSATLRKFILKL